MLVPAFNGAEAGIRRGGPSSLFPPQRVELPFGRANIRRADARNHSETPRINGNSLLVHYTGLRPRGIAGDRAPWRYRLRSDPADASCLGGSIDGKDCGRWTSRRAGVENRDAGDGFHHVAAEAG